MRRALLTMLLVWPLLGASIAPLPVRDLTIQRADGERLTLVVEIASTDEQRQRGLMGRTALAPRHGMLFDFLAPTIAIMWMKDTRLPLDMMFIDAEGQVVSIVARATPGSLTLISAPLQVRYVVELNGGEARALGLAAGDRALLSPGAGRSNDASPPAQ